MPATCYHPQGCEAVNSCKSDLCCTYTHTCMNSHTITCTHLACKRQLDIEFHTPIKAAFLVPGAIVRVRALLFRICQTTLYIHICEAWGPVTAWPCRGWLHLSAWASFQFDRSWSEASPSTFLAFHTITRTSKSSCGGLAIFQGTISRTLSWKTCLESCNIIYKTSEYFKSNNSEWFTIAYNSLRQFEIKVKQFKIFRTFKISQNSSRWFDILKNDLKRFEIS